MNKSITHIALAILLLMNVAAAQDELSWDQLSSEQRQQSPKGQINFWLPAGAVATACLALVVLSLVSKTAVEETVPVDDFELISNIDNLELLEELEFYEWLEDYELPT